MRKGVGERTPPRSLLRSSPFMRDWTQRGCPLSDRTFHHSRDSTLRTFPSEDPDDIPLEITYPPL